MNIGAASDASAVSQRMIRHYEKIGLIPSPPRRDSGYRDYSQADVHLLRFIANARDLGFPIGEIRVLLDLWSDRERASAEVAKLLERFLRGLATGGPAPACRNASMLLRLLISVPS